MDMIFSALRCLLLVSVPQQAHSGLPRASERGHPRLPQGPCWASFALKEMGSFMSTILQTGMQSREAFPLKECKKPEGYFS